MALIPQFMLPKGESDVKSSIQSPSFSTAERKGFGFCVASPHSQAGAISTTCLNWSAQFCVRARQKSVAKSGA